MKNVINSSLLKNYRYYIIFISALLFLPPLSFLFQFTGDSNFCGTWCPRMFFVWRENMTVSTYFMGYMRSYMGVILVFGILVSTFFMGRFWCSHLCPIGGMMELGNKLVPSFLQIDYSSVPAPSFRYGYLTVYFGAAAFGIGSLCCSYCNFATVPRIIGALFSKADLAYFLRTAGLINLGLVVLLGFFAKGGRAYCNFLCPIGALDALSNKIGGKIGKRVLLNRESCNSCGKCKTVCPVWAIDTQEKTIDPLSCIPCMKCEDMCPHHSISYENVHMKFDEIKEGGLNETA